MAPPPVLLAQVGSPPQRTARSDAEVKLIQGKFNSADACGKCHEDIFTRWSSSMHAMSYSNPVFQAALHKAHYRSEGKAARVCLRCHGPVGAIMRDDYGTNALTREGVTCDYCHSINAVVEAPSTGATYKLSLDAKHGPYQVTESPAHKVAYRSLFETSQVCAGCHDLLLPDGTVVFATYSEWKASQYPQKGMECQHCHMPRLPGHTVGTRVPGKGHDVFNDHSLMGGHDAAQIKRAVLARIDSLTRSGNRVTSVIALENAGAGHFVPTGIPSRRLHLSVTATQSARRIFGRDITYQRVMHAGDHKPLTEDWEIKLLSKGVVQDNRLAPGEVRRETFVFDAPPSDDVTVHLRLAYQYDPGISPELRMEVVIAEVDRILARGL